MKTIIYIVLLGILLYSCSRKFLLIPPIPETYLSATEELAYIDSTDQSDRRFSGSMAILTYSKKGKLIIQRDSIRAARVYQLYSADSIKTDNDKFTAGLVFFHSNYTSHNKLAYKIFEDIEKNGENERMREFGRNWKELVYKHRLK